MQRQKKAGEGGDPFNQAEQDQITIKPASLKVPDVHETMKLAGVRDMKLKITKKGKAKVMICCCGVDSCRIGPFTVPKDVET